MNYAYHWRKAMAISACLHIFLLAAAGYLASSLAAPVPAEEVILEMDLVNDPFQRSAANSVQLPQPASLPNAPQPVVTEPAVSDPIQTEVPVKAVVSTSSLSMTEVQLPAGSGSGQPQTAGNDSGSPAGGTSSTGSSPSNVAAPGILSKIDPVYPSTARKTGLEGTVLLRIQILANGRPGDISIARSTGHSLLDEAAVAAVQKWRFIPAKDLSSGRAVTCTTTLPVSFRLNQ